MGRRFIGCLAFATGVALAGCNEQPQEQGPPRPEFLNTTTSCVSSGMNSLIASYFSPPQLSEVKDFKDAMVAALSSDSGTARGYGFNILTRIGERAKTTPQPSPAVGSELAVEVLKCMFDVTDANVIPSVPGPDFFEKSLDHLAGGAFEVRGGSFGTITDPTTDPVVAEDTATGAAFNLAVVAPQESSWPTILPERLLVYGFPVSPLVYEWSTIRRNVTFLSPGAVVAVCVPDGDFNMLQEENVGVLAFQEATTICGFGLSSLGVETGGFGLAQRLRRFGERLLAPTPLFATTVSPGLVGGSAGGLRSKFSVEEIPGVTLSFKDQPQNATVGGVIPPPVTVKAVNQDTGDPMAGVSVTVIAVTNNGLKAPPSNNTATTVMVGNEALATFSQLSLEKAGGYALVAGGAVVGRGKIPVGAATSQKFNVKK